ERRECARDRSDEPHGDDERRDRDRQRNDRSRIDVDRRAGSRGSSFRARHVGIVRAVTSAPMDGGARTLRVRMSVRSALAIVFGLAATVLALEIVHNSQRVIAWVLVAAAIAALVFPAVEWLAHFRFIPRALAVLILVLFGLGTLGFLGYRIGS